MSARINQSRFDNRPTKRFGTRLFIQIYFSSPVILKKNFLFWFSATFVWNFFVLILTNSWSDNAWGIRGFKKVEITDCFLTKCTFKVAHKKALHSLDEQKTFNFCHFCKLVCKRHRYSKNVVRMIWNYFW